MAASDTLTDGGRATTGAERHELLLSTEVEEKGDQGGYLGAGGAVCQLKHLCG